MTRETGLWIAAVTCMTVGHLLFQKYHNKNDSRAAVGIMLLIAGSYMACGYLDLYLTRVFSGVQK